MALIHTEIRASRSIHRLAADPGKTYKLSQCRFLFKIAITLGHGSSSSKWEVQYHLPLPLLVGNIKGSQCSSTVDIT